MSAKSSSGPLMKTQSSKRNIFSCTAPGDMNKYKTVPCCNTEEEHKRPGGNHHMTLSSTRTTKHHCFSKNNSLDPANSQTVGAKLMMALYRELAPCSWNAYCFRSHFDMIEIAEVEDAQRPFTAYNSSVRNINQWECLRYLKFYSPELMWERYIIFKTIRNQEDLLNDLLSK